MIECPICGSATMVERERTALARRCVDVWRYCDNGHTFETREVHVTMVADARELRSALHRINRRVALWARDCAIQRDPRATAIVASEYGVTTTRVRQIRAAPLLTPQTKKRKKINVQTQKGK